MRRRVIISVAVLAVFLLIYLLYPLPPVVEVAEAWRGDLEIDLTTTGIVESDMADVAPRILSTVSSLLVEEGQRVERNQSIALMDTAELRAQLDEARANLTAAQEQQARAEQAVRVEAQQTAAAVARAQAGVRAARARLADVERGARPQEIEQARAAVRQARAEAERAGADLRRAQQLFQQGAIPAQQLDAARSAAQVAEARLRSAEEQLALVEAGARADEVRIARADVQAAEAALAEARAAERAVEIRRREAAAARAQAERAQAAVEAAEARLEDAVVRSPLNGLVVRRHAEVGEIVGPQTPIYTVARLDPVWVTAEVDEEDIAGLELGQRMRITSGAYPGRLAEGTVVRVSQIAEPRAAGRVRARIVRARIDIDSSEFPLLPGMEVDISSGLVVVEDAILVPNRAVIRTGDTTQVLVIQNGVVKPRNVEIGLSSFDHTEIMDGLRPGELVAVSMLDELEEDQEVRIRRVER